MTGVMELQLDDGPRLSLGIGPGSDDVMGPHWEFARKFTEGIEKLTGNTLRDHWKKTERLIVRMREVIRLAGWTPVCLKKEDSGVDVGPMVSNHYDC
ncbi:hypothetical protein BHE74_00059502 [Ensete ventricosum]|nr:hypothetical protein BHE74_00059502 [Ensete ventricosum]